MSTTRQRWLDEGLVVLAEEGEAGLRIDRIATRLGLTKGSFFHHFDGAPAYRAALLAEYERMTLGALADAIEARRGGDTREHARVADRARDVAASETIRRPGLDLAVRAWAASDPEAAQRRHASTPR